MRTGLHEGPKLREVSFNTTILKLEVFNPGGLKLFVSVKFSIFAVQIIIQAFPIRSFLHNLAVSIGVSKAPKLTAMRACRVLFLLMLLLLLTASCAFLPMYGLASLFVPRAVLLFALARSSTCAAASHLFNRLLILL